MGCVREGVMGRGRGVRGVGRVGGRDGGICEGGSYGEGSGDEGYRESGRERLRDWQKRWRYVEYRESGWGDEGGNRERDRRYIYKGGRGGGVCGGEEDGREWRG